jgi:hypothetical protein
MALTSQGLFLEAKERRSSREVTNSKSNLRDGMLSDAPFLSDRLRRFALYVYKLIVSAKSH